MIPPVPLTLLLSGSMLGTKPIHPVIAPPAVSGPALSRPSTVELYDSTEPWQIPAGAHAALYANGSYAASPSDAARFSSVLWIDVFGTRPTAQVVDSEPGDATPAQAAAWAAKRVSLGPNVTAIIYASSSWVPGIRQEVSQDVKASDLPRVKYWVADPTGTRHQYPGASATQWQWNTHTDVSVADSGLLGVR